MTAIASILLLTTIILTFVCVRQWIALSSIRTVIRNRIEWKQELIKAYTISKAEVKDIEMILNFDSTIHKLKSQCEELEELL